MKPIKLMCVLCAVVLLTSCDKSGDVRQFVSDLAAAVSAGDCAAVARLYPEAARADSLAPAFDAAKATIEETDGGWRVTIGEGRDLLVVKGAYSRQFNRS